jgi:hypothetical protein
MGCANSNSKDSGRVVNILEDDTAMIPGISFASKYYAHHTYAYP